MRLKLGPACNTHTASSAATFNPFIEDSSTVPGKMCGFFVGGKDRARFGKNKKQRPDTIYKIIEKKSRV